MFMHDNPLCWADSPGTSSVALLHDSTVPLKRCSSSADDAAATRASGRHPPHVHADHTAAKETQTSRTFTVAALRTALCSQDDTAASSSMMSSAADRASDSRDATSHAIGSDDLTEDTSAGLPPVCDNDETSAAPPPQIGGVSHTRRASPPRRFLSAVHPEPQAVCSQPMDIDCGGRIGALAKSTGITADASVCPSETATVYESCWEPSSVRSSLETTTTSDWGQSRDSCCAETVTAGGKSSQGTQQDAGSGSARGVSDHESLETASGSGAVGYLAFPPGGDDRDDSRTAAAAPGIHGRGDLAGEDTAGVLTRMRVVVTPGLCKVPPLLGAAAVATSAASYEVAASGPVPLWSPADQDVGDTQARTDERTFSSSAPGRLHQPSFDTHCNCGEQISQGGPAQADRLRRQGSHGGGVSMRSQQEPASFHHQPWHVPAALFHGDPSTNAPLAPVCHAPHPPAIPMLQLSCPVRPCDADGLPVPAPAEDSSMMPWSTMTTSESFATASLKSDSGPMASDARDSRGDSHNYTSPAAADDASLSEETLTLPNVSAIDLQGGSSALETRAGHDSEALV